jgi:hypothetical protein
MARRASRPSRVIASAMWREMPQIVLLSYLSYRRSKMAQIACATAIWKKKSASTTCRM